MGIDAESWRVWRKTVKITRSGWLWVALFVGIAIGLNIWALRFAFPNGMILSSMFSVLPVLLIVAPGNRIRESVKSNWDAKNAVKEYLEKPLG